MIGQGLAGTIVALQALRHYGHVTCVDSGSHEIASLAAAGILNPITGPRLNLTWNVHTLMPAAKAFYTEWEGILQTSFFCERTIRRIFRSENETTYHAKRYKNEAVHEFLSCVQPSPPLPYNARSNLGECSINAAVLNIAQFLEASRAWLLKHASLMQTTFRYDELKVTTDGLHWQGNRFDHVIFCEGFGVANNPWFAHLPFKPAKGESLEVELAHPLPPEILSAEKWILPQGGCRALTGSTYEWVDLTSTCTPTAREELLSGLGKMLPENPVIAVHSQRAGVRPCSHNTRPYVGTHPDNPRLSILNGLGSKGTLMAPWCAEQLIKHLTNDTPLHPEMDVRRMKQSPFSG